MTNSPSLALAVTIRNSHHHQEENEEGEDETGDGVDDGRSEGYRDCSEGHSKHLS